VYNVEESWAELNLRIENLAMNLFSSRGMASASNSSARKVVELQEVMICECRAPGKMQICVEVACTVLCTMVVLVLARIKIDNRAKLSTAMEVMKTKYTEPKAEELSKKMTITRRQDENLSSIDARIAQTSTASAQLKITADRKHAMVVIVVEQPKSSSEQKLSLTKGGRGTDSTYQRYTEHAVGKLIKNLSVKKTNLAEDLADLSKKMKLLRTSDVTLVDVDSLTAHSAQTKMEICEKDAAELGEVEGLFADNDETDQDDGLFHSTNLDVEAALGSTNLL
jgi:hypothetical protein